MASAVEKVLHGWCNKKGYTTVYNSQQELRRAIESRAWVAGPDQKSLSVVNIAVQRFEFILGTRSTPHHCAKSAAVRARGSGWWPGRHPRKSKPPYASSLALACAGPVVPLPKDR